MTAGRVLARLGRFVPRTLPPTAAPGQVRVLTYNTHHGASRAGRLGIEAVADTIERCHPDVVALQEVDRHWGPRSGDVDQPAWYAERLGLGVEFAVMVVGPDSPDRPLPQYGLAILSRLPMTRPLQRLYASTRGQDVEPRGWHEVVVDVGPPDLPRRLRVVNTHLSVAHTRLRRPEVAELLAHTAADPELPTVLAGDFNAGPRTAEIDALGAVFRDAWTAGSGPAATSGHRRIDYLWVGRRLRPVQTVVVRSRASDHAALVTDLAWA